MAEIYQPHDRLFRAVFADASEAASLLRNVLPDFVRSSLEWASLTLTPGTFVDEELRLSETDLLYQVEHTGTGQPASVYVLLEHQSSPDPLMRLRLLRYSCRIWEADLRDNPGRRPLRTIVPVVFYQGTSAWTYSTEFGDLFLRSHTRLAVDAQVLPRAAGPDHPHARDGHRQGQDPHRPAAADGRLRPPHP